MIQTTPFLLVIVCVKKVLLQTELETIINYVIISDEGEEDNTSKKQEKQPLAGGKKVKPSSRNRTKDKVAFSHTWLAGALKGHSSRILDMDFSPNGKYVITVGEGKCCWCL